MPQFQSRLNTSTEEFASNREAMLALIERVQTITARAAEKSAASKPRFDKRGALLPRPRGKSTVPVSRFIGSCPQ